MSQNDKKKNIFDEQNLLKIIELTKKKLKYNRAITIKSNTNNETKMIVNFNTTNEIENVDEFMKKKYR